MIEPSPNILIISSNKSELSKVEIFLEEIFRKYNLPHKNYNKVLLCISEAITNAIIHGHKNVSEKKIKVQVVSKDNDVSITVTDEGEGFDIDSIPDPTSEKNIKKESGRGIHIIKSMSDSIEYNEKGNSIQFQIKCK